MSREIQWCQNILRNDNGFHNFANSSEIITIFAAVTVAVT